MRAEQLLEELEKAAEKVGVKVSYETLGPESGQGGLCKVKGSWRLLVDRRAPANDRAVVIARGLASFDLDGVFLHEKAREFVAKFRRASPVEPTAG